MDTSNKIRDDVISMIKDIININVEIDGNTNLHNLGLDSIRICELILEVEEKYNVFVQSDILSNFVIVNDLVSFIEKNAK